MIVDKREAISCVSCIIIRPFVGLLVENGQFLLRWLKGSYVILVSIVIVGANYISLLTTGTLIYVLIQ